MSGAHVDDPVDASTAALARYGAELRRRRLVVYPVVGLVVAAVAALVAVAWSRGEVAHTTLRTASAAPASLPVAAPAASGRQLWRTTDRGALGDPTYGGTVVVYGRHAVRGIDARTGRTTWSYTRTDRTVCAALQTGGTTIAVYRLDGNCDELTALASDTGHRKWTRTLDEDGRPANGPATFQVLPYTVLIASTTSVYAIDPGSGIDRWSYYRFGCTIRGAVLGSTGALISQTCTTPRCAGLKFCGRGPQLLLRDPTAGLDDKGKNPSNFDHILWNLIGDTDVPVSADTTVSALNATTRTLDLLVGGNGRSAGTVSLSPAPTGSGPISAVAAGGTELVTVQGVAAAIDSGAGVATWSRATTGVLTGVATQDGAALALASGRITVPSATGAAILDGATGRVSRDISLSPAPPADSAVYPLGAGQLATGPAGTVVYA